jgi:hypothetical protein
VDALLEQARAQLQPREEEQAARGPAETAGDRFGLVVDGVALGVILRNAERTQRFVEVGRGCASAICCRTTPLQKAQVLAAAKRHLHVLTLAIGDGANDVALIRALFAFRLDSPPSLLVLLSFTPAERGGGQARHTSESAYSDGRERRRRARPTTRSTSSRTSDGCCWFTAATTTSASPASSSSPFTRARPPLLPASHPRQCSLAHRSRLHRTHDLVLLLERVQRSGTFHLRPLPPAPPRCMRTHLACRPSTTRTS